MERQYISPKTNYARELVLNCAQIRFLHLRSCNLHVNMHLGQVDISVMISHSPTWPAGRSHGSTVQKPKKDREAIPNHLHSGEKLFVWVPHKLTKKVESRFDSPMSLRVSNRRKELGKSCGCSGKFFRSRTSLVTSRKVREIAGKF